MNSAVNHRRGLLGVASLGLLLLVMACAPAPVVEVPAGEAGAPGPCGTKMTDLVNRVDWRYPLVVAEPTGDSPAPDGGSCSDDNRPVVLIAHGYLGNFVAGYWGVLVAVASGIYFTLELVGKARELMHVTGMGGGSKQ